MSAVPSLTRLLAGSALALCLTVPAGAEDGFHSLALQLSDGDEAAMREVLDVAANVSRYYSGNAEEVEIRIIVFGPGIDMLREDRSPVLDRLKAFEQSMPNVAFVACQNTIDTMERAEGKEIPILPMAEHVEAGVVELIRLDEAGWTLVRP